MWQFVLNFDENLAIKNLKKNLLLVFLISFFFVYIHSQMGGWGGKKKKAEKLVSF
jgi:hypothetical protein